MLILKKFLNFKNTFYLILFFLVFLITWLIKNPHESTVSTVEAQTCVDVYRPGMHCGIYVCHAHEEPGEPVTLSGPSCTGGANGTIPCRVGAMCYDPKQCCPPGFCRIAADLNDPSNMFVAICVKWGAGLQPPNCYNTSCPAGASFPCP